MSVTCYGSMEEDSDRGGEEEPMGDSAPEAGDSNGEEPPSKAAGIEPAGVLGVNISGDDGQEPSKQTTTETPTEEPPTRPKSGHDDDQGLSTQAAEASAAEEITTHEPATPMLGWGGANLREDRDNWDGVGRPGWGGEGGVSPPGWAGVLVPEPTGDIGTDPGVPEPEGYTGYLLPPTYPDGWLESQCVHDRGDLFCLLKVTYLGGKCTLSPHGQAGRS